MAFEQRDNSGSLWKNDRKTKDNQPDRTGTAMVDGKMYYISGWLKETRDGDPFLSLAFTPKEENERRSATPAKYNSSGRKVDGFDDLDDNIPF